MWEYRIEYCFLDNHACAVFMMKKIPVADFHVRRLLATGAPA
jgi:hypothetical protein